ncbi:MAG: LamG-like jellyroll fold domain-containing protein [Planctomycetota bacterium]
MISAPPLRPGAASLSILLATLIAAGSCSKSSNSSLIAAAGGSSTLSVVMTSPADGDTDVSGPGLISIVFSDRVDPRSLTDESFQVLADGQVVPGRIAVAGVRAMFRASGDFEKSRAHEVVLSDAVRDERGGRLKAPHRFSFTTEPLEPFEVDSTFPIEGQRGVPLDVVVTVRLSRAIDEASVTPESLWLEGPTGRVPGTIEVQADRIRLRPWQGLEPETPFTVALDGSIQASDGTILGEDRVWSFRTDRRYLEIEEVSPKKGGEGTPDLVVEVRFDQELEPTSVHADSFFLEDELGERVDAELSVEGEIVRLRPNGGTVPPGSRLGATLTPEVRARDTGDTLRYAERWSFSILEVASLIFLAENRAGENALFVALVSSRGLLVEHPLSPFETGGAGGNRGRDALALSRDARFLFAANTGSGDVTSFSIGAQGGLATAGAPSPVEGGGPSALEVHPELPLLYVASSDGAGSSIETFAIGEGGSLTQAFDPVPLQPRGAITLASDSRGLRLFVGFEADPVVGILAIGDDGALTLLGIPNVSGGSTSQLALNRRGTWLYPLDPGETLGAIDGYEVRLDGALDLIPGSPFSNAPAIRPSFAMFTRHGELLYVANASGDITIFGVGVEGTLTQIADSPFERLAGSPRLLAGSELGSSLYVIEESPNTLRRLEVTASGGLSATSSEIALSPDAVPAGLLILDRTDDGLLAHWPFDGTGRDLSARENDLELEGEVFESGPRGGALELDGISAHGQSQKLTGLEGDAVFSTALWMQAGAENPALEDEGRHLIGWGSPASNKGSFIGFNGTQDAFEHGFSQNFERTASGFIPGIWYHVAEVYDGQTQRFYVDGALVSARQPGKPSLAPGPFWLGVDPFGEGRFFQGRLDDVRVYSRPLSEREVLDLAWHPKVWMALNEGEGLETADSSGNGSQGFLKKGPKWTEGPHGDSALQFDGINDYVEIADRPTHAASKQITIAAWIKARSFGAWEGIVAKGTSRAPYSMQVWSDGALRVSLNADAHVSNSTTLMTLDRWTHVAITYDGAIVRFFIDGKLDPNQPSVSLTLEGSEEPLIIGCDFQGGDEYFDGAIDDVRLYQRALTKEEIAAIALGH